MAANDCYEKSSTEYAMLNKREIAERTEDAGKLFIGNRLQSFLSDFGHHIRRG
jgi:hypothetical protein